MYKRFCTNLVDLLNHKNGLLKSVVVVFAMKLHINQSVLTTLNLRHTRIFKLRPKTYGRKSYDWWRSANQRGKKRGAKYLIDKQRTYGGSIL